MRIIKTVFVGVLSTVVILGVGYFSNDEIKKIIDRKIELVFPCHTPITYSLGRLDTDFGLNKEEFLTLMKDAESVWESAGSKDLFTYTDSDGGISVNLIYDDRQQSTKILKTLSSSIDNSKLSYDELKQRYTELEKVFNADKRTLLLLIDDLEKDKTALQNEIEYWNKKGNIDKNTYDDLKAREKSITNRIREANQKEKELNALGDTLNTLAKDINTVIEKLNLNVDKFNTTQSTIPDEFDEGEYVEENGERSINIYQFDNRKKLTRVLAHELGHALQIPHNDNPESIMYRLNQGINLALSPEDLASLKQACRTK